MQPANLPVPSTSSPSENLLHPDVVIQKYPKLRNLSTAGRLAVRLAIESYFGKELLHQSTVYGQKDLPPLPRDKVMQLKNKLLSIHLANVSSEVELVWPSLFVARGRESARKSLVTLLYKTWP